MEKWGKLSQVLLLICSNAEDYKFKLLKHSDVLKTEKHKYLVIRGPWNKNTQLSSNEEHNPTKDYVRHIQKDNHG